MEHHLIQFLTSTLSSIRSEEQFQSMELSRLGTTTDFKIQMKEKIQTIGASANVLKVSFDSFVSIFTLPTSINYTIVNSTTYNQDKYLLIQFGSPNSLIEFDYWLSLDANQIYDLLCQDNLSLTIKSEIFDTNDIQSATPVDTKTYTKNFTKFPEPEYRIAVTKTPLVARSGDKFEFEVSITKPAYTNYINQVIEFPLEMKAEGGHTIPTQSSFENFSDLKSMGENYAKGDLQYNKADLSVEQFLDRYNVPVGNNPFYRNREDKTLKLKITNINSTPSTVVEQFRPYTTYKSQGIFVHDASNEPTYSSGELTVDTTNLTRDIKILYQFSENYTDTIPLVVNYPFNFLKDIRFIPEDGTSQMDVPFTNVEIQVKALDDNIQFQPVHQSENNALAKVPTNVISINETTVTANDFESGNTNAKQFNYRVEQLLSNVALRDYLIVAKTAGQHSIEVSYSYQENGENKSKTKIYNFNATVRDQDNAYPFLNTETPIVVNRDYFNTLLGQLSIRIPYRDGSTTQLRTDIKIYEQYSVTLTGTPVQILDQIQTRSYYKDVVKVSYKAKHVSKRYNRN